jgi:hypothetical protein
MWARRRLKPLGKDFDLDSRILIGFKDIDLDQALWGWNKAAIALLSRLEWISRCIRVRKIDCKERLGTLIGKHAVKTVVRMRLAGSFMRMSTVASTIKLPLQPDVDC